MSHVVAATYVHFAVMVWFCFVFCSFLCFLLQLGRFAAFILRNIIWCDMFCSLPFIHVCNITPKPYFLSTIIKALWRIEKIS